MSLFLLCLFITMTAGSVYGEILSSVRRVDWSPGISGGIPTYAVEITATEAPYNATGDGVTDDTTAIQNALNACSSGKAVYLPAGTYRTTTTLDIPDNVVLRGAGTALTFINVDAAAGEGITIDGGGAASRTTLSVIPTRGDTTITVVDATNIVQNDYIIIRHSLFHIASGTHTGANDASVLTDSSQSWTIDSLIGHMIRNVSDGYLSGSTGDEGIGSGGEITDNTADTVTVTLSGGEENKWDNGDTYFIYTKDTIYGRHDYGYSLGFPTWASGMDAQIFKVTNVVGNTLTLSRPVYITYDANLSPVVLELTNPAVNAGVEDLKITYLNNNAGACNITISDAVNCWVKNVESYNAVVAHIKLTGSLACEVRDSYFHHANGNDYGSGRAQGAWLLDNNSDHLVENNIFYYLRHSGIFSCGGTGCVLGYNFSYRMWSDSYPNDNMVTLGMVTHGGNPIHNLYEGNICQKMGGDNAWGGSRFTTYFRNWSRRFNIKTDDVTEMTGGLTAVQMDAHNLYGNFIGNILCRSGDTGTVWSTGCGNYYGCHATDPDVDNTILKCGNYDYVNSAVDSACGETIPNSYYLGSKPTFFRDDEPWPPIGPDVSGYANVIPAMRRFYAPSPPQNLR